ncbi:MAG: hypothetical protein ACRDWV_04035, partial [Acidimicrobiales bacterium]
GSIDAHLDTTSGEVEMNLGHLDTVDLSVTLGYLTARSIFVDANPGAGMQAWMAGKIKVEGDLPKLLAALQVVTVDAASVALAGQIKAITS